MEIILSRDAIIEAMVHLESFHASSDGYPVNQIDVDRAVEHLNRIHESGHNITVQDVRQAVLDGTVTCKKETVVI